MNLAGLEVKTTKGLLCADTRLCACMWSPPKRGKTHWAKGLDDVTKKYMNKPTLIVAVEAADGGGTMTLKDYDVAFVEPKSWTEFTALGAALQTDKTFGGVVIDNLSDLVKRFIQPVALMMPYEKGQPPASRAKGVPAQGDYQTMGEMLRAEINKWVNLTKKDTPPDIRKHLIVTALEHIKTDRKGDDIISVGPALPGQMADTASAMFQTMLTIKVKPTVVPDPADPKKTIRVMQRFVCATSDGKEILGDRMGVFGAEESADLLKTWEDKWLPAMQ